MSFSLRTLGVLAVAIAAGGCIDSSGEAAGLDSPGDGGGAGAIPAECVTDSECAPAASSCCECPSFALSVDSRFDDSCEDVNCESPPSGSCPDTRAVCSPRGACVLECRPVAVAECAQTCGSGYAADSFGCLTCECQLGTDPGLTECSLDEECAKVPSDCCGCARGGADTAVPATQVADFSGELGCDGSAVCPEIDVCQSEVIARCLGGTCQLGAADTPPSTDPDASPTGDAWCGTASLPVCPAGQVCVLNDPGAKDATAAGVGVCRGE